MRVLALDPGERVGWARADVDDEGQWTDLRHGITPLKDMALAVFNAQYYEIVPRPDVNYDPYEVIVMEDWRLRAGNEKQFIGSSFPSVQFVGMIRMVSWLSGATLVLQGASTKSTADKTLAKLWPEMHEKVTQSISHDDGHDLDALRHLWYWTFRNTDVVKARYKEALDEAKHV